jgi:hypothetical protein
MDGVRRILIGIWLVGVLWAATGPVPAREEPVQPCPVLKVIVTEFPTHRKLLMHPAPEEHHTVFGGAASMFDPAKRRGIRVAVLWDNRTGQTLRDITLRLEYQQAKTRDMRTVDLPFPEVPGKSRWTNFELKSGEYEDTVHIAAWCVSVRSGNRVLGSKHSAMWSIQ